ncbi:MAG: hypothetical protein JW788_01295 [Candidatus Omnitrophica bacterium]|nr:hypothetical protein [Candidatus Omnitrophota bacterium]
MSKKIILGIAFILVLIAGIKIGGYMSSNLRGAEDIGARALSQELQAKNVKLAVEEAIKIAEKEGKGKAVAFRLRRMKYNIMGYSVLVLSNDPIALRLIIINATTGKVVAVSAIDTYPIVPGVNKRVAVEERPPIDTVKKE